MSEQQSDAPGEDRLDTEGPLQPSATADSTTDVEDIKPRRSKLEGFQWLVKAAVHAAILLGIFVAGIAGIGVAQRVGWIQGSSATVSGATDHDHSGETIYTCPMHPQIRQNEPGKCPICAMDLVPIAKSNRSAKSQTAAGSSSTDDGRYICPMMCTPPSSEPGRCPVCAMELVEATSGGSMDGISVTIEPAARRLVGIQTATARQGPAEQTIRTIGSIDYDESKLATISAYVGGRIEKLFANYVGVPVQKNDDLALLYSPDLYSAQVEFLTALESDGLKRLGGGVDLAQIAKQNLVELGVTEEQITQIRDRGTAESRIRIKSPISGTVVNKHAVEGDYLRAGDKVYRIADLSTVWLMLDLFPDDAARIRFGQQIEAEVRSVPGEVFTGRIAFIDPTVNPKTQTVRVRVETLNPDGKLRPGDYATARVFVSAIRQDRIYDPMLAGKFISPMHPQVIRDQPGDCPICGMDLIPTAKLGYSTEPLPQEHVVTIPRDALLMAGDNSVVYVETESGRFEIRRVTVGAMTDTEAVILEGIATGEQVATSGNFLIDSQMQLAGNPSLMDPSKAPVYSPGPLKLSKHATIVMPGDAGTEFDRVFQAYFVIQQSLSSDRTPPPITVNRLEESLRKLLQRNDVPDATQSQLQRAKRAINRLDGSIEEARAGFRPLSHALLRAANVARGPQTAEKLVHMFCPMVPGGGGDWMQAGGDLVNPYWGSEMLSCGEVVSDMNVVEVAP
ncbi:MAG: HlyD family efflux transporter periplasmic adaptor subunit [Pirellulaceae bacterium]|nr:HlyD family efflux transporter periplasmic adaptor subunit [Pirellulaceae bacterium]